MKRERVTYEDAYHHVMNRGYNGTDIFAKNRYKSQFLDYLEDSARRMKIRVFAYCVMNNHYHLVLENSRGTLRWLYRISMERKQEKNKNQVKDEDF